LIQGNYVGTDVAGSHALANTFGILLSGSAGNWIGTTGLNDSGDRNVISGNVQTGISLVYAGTDRNVVAGNSIGTDATGTHSLGNGVAGVGVGWAAQNNQIGGLGLLANTLPNTIAFNGGPGVWVISDSTTGDNTTGNSIRDNSIHDNTGLGIDLGGDYDLSTLTSVPGPDGVTRNDSEGHSPPDNPNNFQDFPILNSAITNKGGVTAIAGRFNSGTVNGAPFEPNTTITVDFYANATPAHPFTDPTTGISHYYGEGQIYLGSQTYKTNPNGTFFIAALKPAVTVPGGYYVTATATDPAGNTSEFGPDVLTTTPQAASHGMALTAASAGSSETGSSGGALVAEDLGVYVDNSNGDLTADELARIQDALTAVDAVTAPYGTSITEVTGPSQADVTLSMNTTSAVGGYADGVLGCTTDTGVITLIQGWSWYAGSDPSQVGAEQYDFQTVVTHELGHSLGLGHRADPASVMYATLAPGTARRALATADFNVPDTDNGASGLHATVAPAIPGPPAANGDEMGSAGSSGLPVGPGDNLKAVVGRGAVRPLEVFPLSRISSVAGSKANNVVMGGGGTRPITGSLGRDLLIAGLGTFQHSTGSSGGILMGGWTDYDLTSTAMPYDQKVAALDALMAAWGSTDTYTTRANDQSQSGGLNGSYLLNALTVHESGQVDTLSGIIGPAPAWFLAGAADVVKHKNLGEVQTLIS
jgi:hypothetical protein